MGKWKLFWLCVIIFLVTWFNLFAQYLPQYILDFIFWICVGAVILTAPLMILTVIFYKGSDEKGDVIGSGLILIIITTLTIVLWLFGYKHSNDMILFCVGVPTLFFLYFLTKWLDSQAKQKAFERNPEYFFNKFKNELMGGN